MAPSFGRSISFPLTPGSSSTKSRHVRSISLPCSSHPLLTHLNDHIAAVRSWIQDPATPASGLAHIGSLHAAVADLLLLQDPQDTLIRATNTGNRLLDAFLLLVDAHQGFQEALLELRHASIESRSALRRGDTGRLASAARSQRKAEKDLARIAASVSAVSSKCARLNLVVNNDAEEAEMVGTLMEAAYASAAASTAVFTSVASMSSPTSSCKKITSAFGSFGKKAAPETAEAAIERLHAVERCFEECDRVCDKVFRSIVQTRVSLLNIMTPTI